MYPANARLWLNKCVVQDFATGIECSRGGQLSLQETTVLRCGVAIDMLSSHFELTFRNAVISHSKRHGISIAHEVDPTRKVGQQKYDNITEISRLAKDPLIIYLVLTVLLQLQPIRHFGPMRFFG